MRDDALEELLGLTDGPRNLPPGVEETLLRSILDVADPDSNGSPLLDVRLERSEDHTRPYGHRLIAIAASFAVVLAIAFALTGDSTTNVKPADQPPTTLAVDAASCEVVTARFDAAGLRVGVVDPTRLTITSMTPLEESLQAIVEPQTGASDSRSRALGLVRLVRLELDRGAELNPQLVDDLVEALDAWDPIATACPDR